MLGYPLLAFMLPTLPFTSSLPWDLPPSSVPSLPSPCSLWGQARWAGQYSRWWSLPLAGRGSYDGSAARWILIEPLAPVGVTNHYNKTRQGGMSVTASMTLHVPGEDTESTEKQSRWGAQISWLQAQCESSVGSGWWQTTSHWTWPLLSELDHFCTLHWSSKPLPATFLAKSKHLACPHLISPEGYRN